MRALSVALIAASLIAGAVLPSALAQEAVAEDSCVGFCGTNAATCFCDLLCTNFNDCCADVCEACNICDSGLNLSSSCEGNCGANAGLCFCDALCSAYGDCCDDACDVCTPDQGGPTACLESNCSADVCGAQSPSGGCFCDALCTQVGDCCPGDAGLNQGPGSACDACGFCGEEETEVTSCDGMCGQFTGVCLCDDICTTFGNCCEDVEEFCGTPINTSCEGLCGGKAYNCFCEPPCTLYGDCCEDAEEQCPCIFSCGDSAASGECSCASDCENNGDCCDDYQATCGLVGSCVGFCGGVNPNAGCACDALCTAMDDCCDDAVEICLSCSEDVCGAGTAACGCDNLCSILGDCCANACDVCSNGCVAPPPVCAVDTQVPLKLSIVSDQFPDEISYELMDVTNGVMSTIAKGAFEGVAFEACLLIGHTYILSVLDSLGNGFDPGSFSIDVNGTVLISDGDIGLSKSYSVEVTETGDPLFTLADTPCQQLLDCNGECMGMQFAAWVGDGICDDGGYGELPNGGGIVLVCENHQNDGGDCDQPLDLTAVAATMPEPIVSFPFNQGNGIAFPAANNELITAQLQGASWVLDNLKQTPVIQCVKDQGDLVTITDFSYGGNFTVFLAFRHEDSPGNLFEYLLSHGDAFPSIATQNNFNIYFPEAAHNAHGIVRTLVYDFNDNHQEDNVYLDSDGQINNNSPRNIPGHVNIVDDAWHMIAVRKTLKFGYDVFIDGRKYATMDQILAKNLMNPKGQIHLCGRSDNNPDRHFGGYIADFHVFNTPLSDIEVLAFVESLGYTDTDCPAGQVKDLCDVCGGSNGKIAPDSNEVCCEELTFSGDTNNDGILSVLDIVLVANYIIEQGSLTPCQEIGGDINGDSKISVTDVLSIYYQI